MNIINIIIFILLILPIHWVITDILEGKIKNYFIFPSIFVLIILSLFLEWFYFNLDNIVYILIILSLSFLFYKNNKWWAWDWKYLILIWFSTIIIWYLKWINSLVLKLIIYTFSIFLFYVFVYLILNFNQIKKIEFKKYKIVFFDLFFNAFLLFLLSFLISLFLPNKDYSFLLIFVFMVLVLPILNKIIINKYFKYLIILFWIIFLFFTRTYLSFLIIFFIYLLFNFIQEFFDQIFDLIDIKEIEIIEIKQWSILTKESIKKFKNEASLEFEVSPLQWLDIFNIIDFYKNSFHKNDKITIYKDLRIWIIFYIWYFVTIVEIYLKTN